ncbi:MAG: hypothetical protein M3Z85_05550 [Acidobacteriota bacterium]|nr:hypothetical protein [Acidobacteriota bacterium]
MSLSILNDSHRDSSRILFERFTSENVLERLKAVDRRAREEGLESLDPQDDALIRIGMEVDDSGRVTKNSLGVFNLSWQAQQHPEWAEQVAAEVATLKREIAEAHAVPLRFLIWAGMGGSIEDKSMYNAVGLLRGGPRVYSLDSTDPAKLKAIVHDMQERSGLSMPEILKSTLVVGMAMGMTSYEPVVNLEKLAALYERNHIDSRANFVYMTMPGSVLDQFAGPRGYRRIPLQMDEDNSTAGRHSAPLTRGSLIPLALAGVDLKSWIAATFLSEEEIQTAWKLAAFLQAQALEGRDKVTVLLPKSWAGAGLWTKQDFEESLGKSEEIGVKVVIQEKVKVRYLRHASDQKQDRVFLAVQLKGEAHPEAAGITALRHARYPIAILTLPATAPLSRYMQFIHYTVFGLGYLRNMNFVTQPGVELYKAIASEVFEEAKQAGGTQNTAAWKELLQEQKKRTPERYAAELKKLASSREIEYGELTFFGDLRYSEEGRNMRKSLERAADRVFRSRLKMPVDIYEGPAMNHSYHEMIIGHGKCFSTILISEKQSRFPAAGYEPDYHMAQFLATKMALERKGRHVVALVVKDLTDASLLKLDEFFREAAAKLVEI